jgi:carbamoyl-phosphate synthase large subunit
MVMPPYTLPTATLDEIRTQTVALGKALEVRGLMNVQFAVQDGEVFILEVNPRASRTIPFITKATGVPLAKIAARIMVGRRLKEMGLRQEQPPLMCAVKKSVFPWNRFPGCDPLLGPEMHSTGEVMGLDRDFGSAFAKAHIAGGHPLPQKGASILVTVQDRDKADVLYVARRLLSLGYQIASTPGTQRFLESQGVRPVRLVHPIGEGRPDSLDLITNGEVDLIINTTRGDHSARSHKETIRACAERRGVPCITTVPGAAAVLAGIEAVGRPGGLESYALQDLAPSHV